MLEDYKKVVISSYLEMKEKKLLSSNLIQPTPGQLRDECLLVLHSRPQVKDEKIIRDFFNLGAESNDYSPSIRRFDVDRLRPLVRIMRGQIDDTNPRNIELLAWLINFEPRPYQYALNYIPDKEIPEEKIKDTREETKPEEPKKEESEPEETEIPPPVHSARLGRYTIDLIIFLITIIGGIGLSMRNASIEQNTTAYICTSKVAKKYHLNPKCHGLNRCGNASGSKIVTTTIAEARELNRTLCEIESVSVFYCVRLKYLQFK